jgi:5'-methylthioadenosine phosphorylase
VRVGLITGSGTDSLPGIERAASRVLETRYGSSLLTEGSLAGTEVVHVSRHGPGHARLSNHVNHRANIVALQEAGAEAIIAVTVCGALDPELELGSLIVFDDLYFLSNRLPGGELCTLHDQPGVPGRGHWVFERPFSEPLRAALRHGARQTQCPVREFGCYGHVDGPRFNTRAEIRMLAGCGVTAVSQTGGPETALAGEAGLPYALLGYATDYANGVSAEATPVHELMRLIRASTESFGAALAPALEKLGGEGPPPTGTVITFE